MAAAGKGEDDASREHDRRELQSNKFRDKKRKVTLSLIKAYSDTRRKTKET